ncbi:MAG: glycosyltransferase, exosortase A system-associated [Abditibacteriales bacterium]|nr:glycosyltransferase, exosortase A system-associated [Abditibacteriales bacterium]MDW8366103.1 glycosyltransferase, exosortase A system-associated [Abditibacteriales bacterium]
MRILHVLHYSVPMLSGYTMRSKYIVEAQRHLGWEVAVVTSPRQEMRNGFVAQENIDDLTYFRTPPLGQGKLSRLPFVREQLHVRTLAKRLQSLLRQSHYDVVHAHSPCLCGLAALRGAGNRPVVYEVRGLWEETATTQGKFSAGSLKYRVARRMEETVFHRAQAVVTISQGLKDDLVERGVPEQKISVVPNGVETSKFVPRAEKPTDLIERHQLHGCAVLGFIGSFFGYEGLPLLVEAMTHILGQNRRVKLLLVGTGEDEEKLKQLVSERRLNDQVLLVGRVPHEEILGYYALMDVLIYPRLSTRETERVTPLKPLEAMAMEKAVLASNVGGQRELVEDGVNGLLFKAGDARDLAAQCLRLIADDQLRRALGQQARSYVVAEREWSQIVRRYAPVYESVGLKLN